MKVTIVNPKKKRVPLQKVKTVAEKTLKKFKVNKDVTVCFVDDRTIRKYNKKFLHKDKATDVISFYYENDPCYLGDVMVSVDAARRNSKIFGTGYHREIVLYVLHGILHLLGFDDRTAEGREKMERAQNNMLKQWRF